MGKIGIVLISHSEKIADGLKELVNQMNDGSVPVIAAGGAAEGRIGTDATKIMAAVEELEDMEHILIYCDLGSAIMSAETALDLVDEDLADKCQLVDCPLVEGALAGVVQATITDDVDEVVKASMGSRTASMLLLGYKLMLRAVSDE